MPKQTFFNLIREKRQLIADLALDEFSRHPYVQASISQIVDRAGISKGSFYQYFENKLDLYSWLIFEVTAERKLAYFRAHPPPEGLDLFDQIEWMLVSGLKFGLENPRLAQFASWMWHATSDPNLRPIHRRYRRLANRSMADLLRQGIAAGNIRADIDIDIASDFLLATLQQGLDLSLQRLVGMDMLEFISHPELAHQLPEAEQRRIVHGLVELLRHGLGTSEGGGPIQLDLEAMTRDALDMEGLE